MLCMSVCRNTAGVAGEPKVISPPSRLLNLWSYDYPDSVFDLYPPHIHTHTPMFTCTPKPSKYDYVLFYRRRNSWSYCWSFMRSPAVWYSIVLIFIWYYVIVVVISLGESHRCCEWNIHRNFPSNYCIMCLSCYCVHSYIYKYSYVQ